MGNQLKKIRELGGDAARRSGITKGDSSDKQDDGKGRDGSTTAMVHQSSVDATGPTDEVTAGDDAHSSAVDVTPTADSNDDKRTDINEVPFFFMYQLSFLFQQNICKHLLLPISSSIIKID